MKKIQEQERIENMRERILIVLNLFAILLQTAIAQPNTEVFKWCGAVTDSSVKINCKLQFASSNIKFVADVSPNFSSPIFSTYAMPDTSNNNLYNSTISGLQPNTKYYYAVFENGTILPNTVSDFTTATYQPLSFSFGAASCSYSGNHAVYNVINNMHPRFFIVSGDLHYWDPNSLNINLHRNPYAFTLSQPAIKNFLQHTPIAYVWDDHDFSGNNGDGTSIGKHSASVAYRENVPHFPFHNSIVDGGIYQSFNYGRVHFILTDLRSERLEGQHLISALQMAWLKNEIVTARNNNLFPVWISSVSFSGNNEYDNWSGYTAQRIQIANCLRDSLIKNLLIICGDAHMLAIDDGSNGNFTTGAPNPNKYPIFQAAALNRFGSVKGGTFSSGVFPNPTPQTGQFGIVDVVDNGGDTLCFNLKAIRTDSVGANTSIITSYSFCRNIDKNWDSVIENLSENKVDLVTHYFENDKLIIKNKSAELIESIVVSNLQSQSIFKEENILPNQKVEFCVNTNHGVFIITVKTKSKKQVMKVGL